MKKLAIIFSALALCSCQWDPYEHDIEISGERLSVTASSDSIVLLEENLRSQTITFDWTEARRMSDDYIVSYTTLLDVVGNNFGESTRIMNSEDDGIFSRTFTYEQINNWANEKWKLPINKPFSLEFRVIVEWMGGPTFEMPEVRTTTVDVTPIKIVIFSADEVALGGPAMADNSQTMSQTLENQQKYAWKGTLSSGELHIPVLQDGNTFYIVPSDGDDTLHDGQSVEVKMDEAATGWYIPASGEYRIVIDMEQKSVAIYSEATDLQPYFATFRPNGADANPETTIEVTELWAYGDATGWGARKLNCVQSLADPQILIYSGNNLSGSAKFCIAQNFEVGGVSYNQNNVFCFTGVMEGQGNVAAEIGKWNDIQGGASSTVRNTYLQFRSAVNFIIFDLRNMRVYPELRSN